MYVDKFIQMKEQRERELIQPDAAYHPDDCVEIHNNFQVDWSAFGVGYGQFFFYIDKNDNKLHCSNEMMSKKFIKGMLCKMVDDCILDDI